MNEIEFDRVNEYSSAFRDPQMEMVLGAIRAGNSRAQLWQGDGFFWLWDKANNVFYPAGDPPGSGKLRELADWVVDGLRPKALEERRARFSLRPLAPGWEGLLGQLFRGVAFVEHAKLFYRYQNTQPPAPPPHTAGVDVCYESIDGGLLARKDLRGVDDVRAEAAWMWPSVERFEQRGFGVAAVKAGRILCWCTAEYVSGTMCGIGIETMEGYEGKGLATAVTAAFVTEAIRRGLTPHWECDGMNTGSVRVAEKSGFDLIQKERVWIGRFV